MKILYLLCMVGFVMACQPSTNNQLEYPKGGYAYPTDINPRDSGFYFYPLVDSFGILDSITLAILGQYTMPAFNESNLSLRPQRTEIYRFFRHSAFWETVVITITPEEIIAKVNGKEYPYIRMRDEDTTLLSPEEREDYSLLGYIPIDEKMKELDTNTVRGKRRFRYLDSLAKKRPQLRSASYFVELYGKAIVPLKGEKRYIEYRQRITPEQYDNWTHLVDSSGYWQMPFDITDKEKAGADGSFVILEANTKKRYKYVQRDFEAFDRYGLFEKVCDSLVSLSGMYKDR